MKTRLNTSLSQQQTLTPQLQQALRLLQLSAAELEQELAQAVASNPLLEWAEEAHQNSEPDAGDAPAASSGASADGSQAPPATEQGDAPDWIPDQGPWATGSRHDGDNDYETPALKLGDGEQELGEHLRPQFQLLPLSKRDQHIGLALIDAIDSDGYLRESLPAIAQALQPELLASEDEILAVLRHVQGLEPTGVGARDLGECLALQLQLLPATQPGRELALLVARTTLPRLPRAGIDGLAREMRQPVAAMQTAVELLRRLDPRPGRLVGQTSSNSWVVPDVVIWRQRGQWQAALAGHSGPPVVIHQGYAQLLGHCSDSDSNYLRSHLQQARWLIRGLQQRGQTLLRISRALLVHQAAYLEYGRQALRPLTLREMAAELELHESTISRAIAGKYVRTPRGTVALREFFSTGMDTGNGEETASSAIQATLARLIEAENPRKPLSDAKLTELLKQSGMTVARRTVAKYREAMNIPPSHERVRIG
jgi:RNA polymerase sigma-54 factor